MASLYELTGDFLKFSLIAEQSELDDEMQAMLSEALENLADDIDNKLEGYAKVIKNFEADIAAFKAEEEMFALKRKTLENRIKNMKSAMTNAMIATGHESVKTTLFTFKVQRNPGTVILDEQYIENIPERYLIPQEPKVDKKAIKADIDAGVDLDGVAHIEYTKGVRIR